MSDINSDIDNLLAIDNDKDLKRGSVPEENIEELELNSSPVLTKHTVVTSPWSRLGIIAVPFGLSFLAIFWLLNGIFNPAQQSIKTTKQPQDSSEAVEKAEQKDGDVYALLALDQQEEELSKINNNKTQKPQVDPKTNKTQNIASTPTQKAPRLVQRYNQPETLKTTSRVSRSKEPPRSFVTARASNPTSSITSTTRVQKALDPTAEFNRLRNIGSYGLIAYADSSVGESTMPDPALTTSSQQVEPKSSDSADNSESTQTTSTEATEKSIEKIRPWWQSQSVNNYLSQEDQIIQEQQTRYLTVGEFASGVLITPVVKQQADTRNQSQQTDDGKRFVAKLTQDLRDNYGNVAIASGSLLAVEVVSIDGSNYAQVQVTSIIKDKTEYPISSGAMTVQGSGGKPLIAKKFQNKGGEIAQYDLTVGLVGGLAKVGEVINQPDVQQSIQNGFGDGFSSNTTIQNNRRNIGGAFLNGAFGKLGDIVSRRAERSTQEILARPNVWFIPQGTKVTFIVNRTLELP
ncbi:hypothetical protein A6770_37030 [Nostoc minutum NIES-26]|uniref:Bacterial conjugation TrbI-like protein n=1 Tax=Nostoc minutum NIES-26 TaxID=1844469 RepID=A0A367RY63_9NOSO|nr:hypothetical protein A6770_37030 [Nostoc minutum NIES-26]